MPKGKLVLIDDLPFTATPQLRQRMVNILKDLARTARWPVVLVLTDMADSPGEDSGRTAGRAGVKDLASDLQSEGGTVIHFNPITTANAAKAMTAICEEEGCDLLPATIKSIAELSHGDLRNAVQTLQVVAAHGGRLPGQQGGRQKKLTKKPARGVKAKQEAAEQLEAVQKMTEHMHRDMGLSLYSTLGRVLYNKRSEGPLADDDSGRSPGKKTQKPHQQQKPCWWRASRPIECKVVDAPLTLLAHHQRAPLVDDPDMVVQRSGLDAKVIIAFLHENYPHFIDEEAAEDMALAAEYLSSAAFIDGHRNTTGYTWEAWEDQDWGATSIQQATASSVAARGLMYANLHPAPRRWLPLKGPLSLTASKGQKSNMEHLRGLCHQPLVVHQCPLVWSTAGRYTVDVLPYLRLLTRHWPHMHVRQWLPDKWTYLWQGALQVHPLGVPQPDVGYQCGVGGQDVLGELHGGDEDTIED